MFLGVDRSFKHCYCSLTAPYSVNEQYELWGTLITHPPNYNCYHCVSLWGNGGIFKVYLCVCVLPGLSDLIHDNLTESKRTINLLQRMNIYQEVFLSVLYRLLPIQVPHHSAVVCLQLACKTQTIRVTAATIITKWLTVSVTPLVIFNKAFLICEKCKRK